MRSTARGLRPWTRTISTAAAAAPLPTPHSAPLPTPLSAAPPQVRLGRTPGRVRLVAAAGAAALALSAGLATPLSPAPSQAHAADDDGKVLTVAVAQSVDSLSPFLAVRLLSTSIHRLTYEYLTNYDPEDNHVVRVWPPSGSPPRTS
ncbi:hypothetical protein SUDANB21_05072 [Streptomyces sp. enrichment culture]